MQQGINILASGLLTPRSWGHYVPYLHIKPYHPKNKTLENFSSNTLDPTPQLLNEKEKLRKENQM